MLINQPRATYRLQLTPAFDFSAAAQQAEYLSKLGISHIYCSPYLQSAPGSLHGYDIVDPHRVNEELGGDIGLATLLEQMQKHGLEQVLDIVPNHMSIASGNNPWWCDVLENGPSSRYASYFDVDWDAPAARHSNVVLVPILGDHYGRVVDDLLIQIAFDGRNFTVCYYGYKLPVDPNSVSTILASAAEKQPSAQLDFLAGAFARLPQATATDRASARRRFHDKEVLYDWLHQLVTEQIEIQQAITATVSDLNASPDLLDIFLDMQNYRLAFWRISHTELGYRRFFDINSLIGLRIEDELVYLDSHTLIHKWLSDGKLSGLRIDHPDGLRDPKQYLLRLRAASPAAWIVVEKILEDHERLPSDWPVQGTSGYDFLNRVNGLMINPQAETALTDCYTQFTGRSADYPTLVREKKLFAASEILGSDLGHLTALFMEVCERHRRYRDYDRSELRATLAETAACLAVYRTYIRPEENEVSPADTLLIDTAIRTAQANRPDLDPALFDFLCDLLLLRVRGDVESELVQRFQQFSTPVMAKGIEDTLFYSFNRLVSLNEVGGNPGRFGIVPETFHIACQETLENWPLTLLATSTHDTKRSEDVRARLNVITELPQAWAAAVQHWAVMNAPFRTNEQPDRNDEYLLYQTMVGAWPLELDRAQNYMLKAIREANIHTSWRNPNQAYEDAAAVFIQQAYANHAFLNDLQEFVGQIILPGRINSLSQTLLKLTAPGVPDLYQGSELWDLSLVDPDNRRPVDFALRSRLLKGLSPHTPPETVLEGIEEGLPKLWVVHQTLRIRSKFPQLFSPNSTYTPINVAGDMAVAYLRGNRLLVITPRLSLQNRPHWSNVMIELPGGLWQNVFTHEKLLGGVYALATLLARFPVALLLKINSTEEDSK